MLSRLAGPFDANAQAVVGMGTTEKNQPVIGDFQMQCLVEQTANACAGYLRSANTRCRVWNPETGFGSCLP